MCLLNAAATTSGLLFGTLISIAKRDLRSTSVAICEEGVPHSKSPSQCPGTARSSTSAGRSRIHSASSIYLCELR